MEGSPDSLNSKDRHTSMIEAQLPLDSVRITEDDNTLNQTAARSATESSSQTMPLGTTRLQPLTLPSDSNSAGSPRLGWGVGIPSSLESTAQTFPLQTHSPASLIFERNVQEDVLLPQTSPSIPSHIRTENHIPPVLEASSAAITDSGLNPDSVAIVTHSIHHTTNTSVVSGEQLSPSFSSEGADADIGDPEEFAPPSRVPDTNDIRRLSFISFADVVNAEHAETSEHQLGRDFCQGPASTGIVYHNRSPSPLHSPASSHAFGTSPPTSISTSFKGLDLSPNRGGRGADSPLFAAQRPISPSFASELNVETMRQALRRTGSGELSTSRSQISSTVGNDD